MHHDQLVVSPEILSGSQALLPTRSLRKSTAGAHVILWTLACRLFHGVLHDLPPAQRIFFPVRVNVAPSVFTGFLVATLVGFVLSWNLVHHFDPLH